MTHTKTFLLGVGAQKAGTTWIHKQLCKNYFFSPGFTKEYHTFDTIYTPQYGDWITTWLTKLDSIDKSLPIQRAKKASLLKRLLFVHEPASYFEYFKELASHSPDIKLVGDITPSYSMLGKKAFSEIKLRLEEKGFNVKVIFLMRDPVERIWSAKRMQHRHAMSNNKKINVPIETSLLRSINNKGSELKTDYQRTIKNIEEVFSANNIFYGFFEELFTESSYGRFRDFIDLDLAEPDYGKAVNASPKQSELPEELIVKIAQKYKSTYEYIDRHFDGAASNLWKRNYILSQG